MIRSFLEEMCYNDIKYIIIVIPVKVIIPESIVPEHQEPKLETFPRQ